MFDIAKNNDCSLLFIIGLFFSFTQMIFSQENVPPCENCITVKGAIIRMDTTKHEIHLVFTAHDFAEGGEIIRAALKKHHAPASFFFTGDFYRNPKFKTFIEELQRDGYYLGGHSNKHVLYAPWENQDSLLISNEEFMKDIAANYSAMQSFGIEKRDAPYFLPPYEWYNDSIAAWSKEFGLTLIDFTPGTYSNADYTTPDMGTRYLSSNTIFNRILTYEQHDRHGLNGFILLTHIGTDAARTDKFYNKFDALLTALEKRGYTFTPLGK
jgi:endoglucanase